MQLQKDDLIRVFNVHYPNGKLRYFKDIGGESGSRVVVYADGATSKTETGGEEWWDTWEKPSFVKKTYPTKEPTSDWFVSHGWAKCNPILRADTPKKTTKNKCKVIAFSGTQGTGKTTSALQETINQKMNHPEKSVHCLVNLEAFCPYPINKETTENGQAWLFANHLQQLLSATQKYDIVILDRTLIDVVAYSKIAGFISQANSMMVFLNYHIKLYSEIRIKKAEDNQFCFDDGIRDAGDSLFRDQVEITLLDLYHDVSAVSGHAQIYGL